MSDTAGGAPAEGALAGLRVLDLTRYVPGPYCTLLLGDLGADVVKLEEPPFGDPTRAVPPALGEDSALHAALNRNKRSLLVDLRQDGGVALVRRLAARADVLVESYRPGTLARRGLGPEPLLEANPRLVYCSLSGYGQDGPLAGHAGHDIDYLARAGFLGTNRDATGRPTVTGATVADLAGALTATIGILAALQARERTGRGQVVEASLFEAALALMTVPAVRQLAGASGPGELSGEQPSYGVYRCRDDRYVSVGALEPKFWEGVCRGLGLEDRIGRQWERAERRRETRAALAAAFATRARDEWVAALAPADACVEPVLDLDEALAQEHVSARGLTGGAWGDAALAPPVRLSRTPPARRRGAPKAGEHTAEVLSEAGYSAGEVAALREQGVVA